jgi:hypothetical protein
MLGMNVQTASTAVASDTRNTSLQTFITALLNTKVASSIAPPRKQNSRRTDSVQDCNLQTMDRKLF